MYIKINICTYKTFKLAKRTMFLMKNHFREIRQCAVFLSVCKIIFSALLILFTNTKRSLCNMNKFPQKRKADGWKWQYKNSIVFYCLKITASSTRQEALLKLFYLIMGKLEMAKTPICKFVNFLPFEIEFILPFELHC